MEIKKIEVKKGKRMQEINVFNDTMYAGSITTKDGEHTHNILKWLGEGMNDKIGLVPTKFNFVLAK